MKVRFPRVNSCVLLLQAEKSHDFVQTSSFESRRRRLEQSWKQNIFSPSFHWFHFHSSLVCEWVNDNRNALMETFFSWERSNFCHTSAITRRTRKRSYTYTHRDTHALHIRIYICTVYETDRWNHSSMSKAELEREKWNAVNSKMPFTRREPIIHTRTLLIPSNVIWETKKLGIRKEEGRENLISALIYKLCTPILLINGAKKPVFKLPRG